MKKMLNILVVLCMSVSLLSGMTFPASAAMRGSCGKNLSWKLEGGTLTISGTGAMKDYSWNGAPWYSSRGSITTVVIEDGVMSIGESAFYNCESLTTVTIPNSVTSIGDEAFYDCNSLKSITIPEDVTSIGEYAFSCCYDLKWVAIPVSLEMIGWYAFSYCYALTDVYYKGDEAAREEIAIPSGNDEFKNATWHYNAEPVTELLGDVNLDEDVDISDAVMLFQYSMLPDLYPIEYKGDLDFTKDGVVDISDAVLLFQHSMLPDLYPIGYKC